MRVFPWALVVILSAVKANFQVRVNIDTDMGALYGVAHVTWGSGDLNPFSSQHRWVVARETRYCTVTS